MHLSVQSPPLVIMLHLFSFFLLGGGSSLGCGLCLHLLPAVFLSSAPCPSFLLLSVLPLPLLLLFLLLSVPVKFHVRQRLDKFHLNRLDRATPHMDQRRHFLTRGTITILSLLLQTSKLEEETSISELTTHFSYTLVPLQTLRVRAAFSPPQIRRLPPA